MLAVIVSLFFTVFCPRTVFILLWALTAYIGKALGDSFILWPILGFIFLPRFLTIYVLHSGMTTGEWTAPWVISAVIMVFFDLLAKIGFVARLGD